MFMYISIGENGGRYHASMQTQLKAAKEYRLLKLTTRIFVLLVFAKSTTGCTLRAKNKGPFRFSLSVCLHSLARRFLVSNRIIDF